MDSIIASSDAVVLIDENVVRIINGFEAEHTVKRKILIKNEDGEDYCKLQLRASQFVIIEEIEAVIYDMNGEMIKELDDDDIEENAISPRGILYSDDSYIFFSLAHLSYPYILVYSYTRELKSLFFWPDWYPQWDIPVLASKYELILEEPVEYNSFKKGLEIEPEIRTEEGNKVYTWQIKNMKPRIIEDNMAPEDKFQNFLRISPLHYSLGDYQGSFENWNALARWYYDMSVDRYALPDNAVQEVKELIKNIIDDKEKIRYLYNYLQEKTRYVAISLDVGGWQPHSATSTYKNRYGDCKDLSTLMVAMLDIAGIKAYPALALTRSNGIVYEEFPSSQFNHCITVIPMKEDTIYLECTADFVDMDDTPYNIEGIKVLMVENNGGRLIQTTKSNAIQNSWKSFLEGSLKYNGDLEFKGKIITTGNKKNYYKRNFGFKKAKDELVFLQRIFGRYFASPEITNYSYEEDEFGERPLVINTEGKYKKFGSISGKRIFLNPNIFNQKLDSSIPDEEERIYDIYFDFPYLDVDTVSIKLPASYKLEAAPKEHKLIETFAKYVTSYSYSDGIFFYTRSLEYMTNRIEANKYDNYRKFIKAVSKSDQSKFIFKK